MVIFRGVNLLHVRPKAKRRLLALKQSKQHLDDAFGIDTPNTPPPPLPQTDINSLYNNVECVSELTADNKLLSNFLNSIDSLFDNVPFHTSLVIVMLTLWAWQWLPVLTTVKR